MPHESGREAMCFGLFILGSIFQVCWVRAPISKAIVKHMRSKTKNRKQRNSGSARTAPGD